MFYQNVRREFYTNSVPHTDWLALGEDGLVPLWLEVDEGGVQGQVDHLAGGHRLQLLLQPSPTNKLSLQRDNTGIQLKGTVPRYFNPPPPHFFR